MKKKPTYNPYAIQDQSGFLKWTHRIVWLCPLISLALYFFVYQLLVANRAPSFLATAAFYLNEAFSGAVLFAFLALFVLTVAHEEKALGGKLLLWQTASLFLLSFVLRVAFYLLTLFVDSLGIFGGFYLNDRLFSYFFADGGFNFWFNLVLPTLVGVLSMFFVILLSRYFVKKAYGGALRGKTNEKLLKIPILVYLAVSVAFALFESVMTVIELGFALKLSVVLTLILPYIKIGVLTLIGQYVIEEVVSRFEA